MAARPRAVGSNGGVDRTALEAVRRRAARQDDVLTLPQLHALGLSADVVERAVAGGSFQRPHRGVVVVHSGPVSWRTRARAALLRAGPGAHLSHAAAGYVLQYLDRPPRQIDVSIPAHRRVAPSAGMRVHRTRHLEGELVAGLPVTTRASTVLDLVGSARSADGAVAVVAAAMRSGTWPEQVLAAAETRQRVPRRGLLLAMLAAVADGAESPLELRYHRDVERRHGLPRSTRQRWELVDGRWIRADVRYPRFGVRVELDGCFAHPGGRTDADTWRDNAVAITHAELTLRYRWRHVAGEPCATAAQVAQALAARGWDGSPHPCDRACVVVPR